MAVSQAPGRIRRQPSTTTPCPSYRATAASMTKLVLLQISQPLAACADAEPAPIAQRETNAASAAANLENNCAGTMFGKQLHQKGVFRAAVEDDRASYTILDGHCGGFKFRNHPT